MALIAIKNETGNEKLEYLATGFTDAFVNRLSGLSKVELKAPNINKKAQVDPLKIGKDLGVDGGPCRQDFRQRGSASARANC